MRTSNAAKPVTAKTANGLREVCLAGERDGFRDSKNSAQKQMLDELAAARRHLELRAEANEVIAAWRDELAVRIARIRLKAELIGIDDDEHDALVAEVAEYKRLCRAIDWSPAGSRRG